MIAKFGITKVKIAMVLTGTVFGLAMFYEVAFIIMAPLIVAVAVEAKMPFMKIAIPAVAASFWLFKGYFDLSVKDTLKTWGMLELSCSIVGLGMVLLLSIFV